MTESEPPSTHPHHPAFPSSDTARSRSVDRAFGEGSAFSTRGQRLPQIIQSQVRCKSSSSRRRSASAPNVDRWLDHEGPVEENITASIATLPPPPQQQQQRAEHGSRRNKASVSGDGRGIDLEGFSMSNSSNSHDGARDILPPEPPTPPTDFPLARTKSVSEDKTRSERRASMLMTPQMRSQRLIGNSNPRYRWEQYYTAEEQLKTMKKRNIRKYYERNNYLVVQYLYIDRLLDSSLPHSLIAEYHQQAPQKKIDIPPTIGEESSSSTETPSDGHSSSSSGVPQDVTGAPPRVKRTKSIYKVKLNETTPLLSGEDNELPDGGEVENQLPAFQVEEDSDSSARVVTIAIYINLVANTLLLMLKIIVTVLTSSLSVLASLVDAALDFLSTAIVWTTTRLIASSRSERDKYPVGRQRLEPIGVLVFSVIMITSFFQVALEALNRLAGPDRTVVELSPAAIVIMSSTVVVKGLCWFWCRLVRNSSVQALAQDAVTDVVFNLFSIIFPLLGFLAKIWWLDPLGGLVLSLYVIISWSLTTRTHILNLVGQTASADERNILLYLTMRFAKCIRRIQNIAVYHVGDKLNVEVDIVLDEDVIGDGEGNEETLKPGARALRDIHDLGESLQYVLESVPGVERAFVHSDYWEGNLPSHMSQ